MRRAPLRRHPGRWRAVLVLLATAVGCADILGFEKSELEPIHCQSSDQCGPQSSCLFNRCLRECMSEADCADGRICVQDEMGSGCVLVEEMTCGDGGQCPTGMTCQAGLCRIECQGDADCPAGWACTAAGCVDPGAPPSDGGSPVGENCGNGVRDPGESDVDCGGSECSKCPPTWVCERDDDCDTGYCAWMRCASPSCTDHFLAGNEIGTDCGGDCPPCGDGQGCGRDEDCTSQVCRNQICEPPRCDDGVQNGKESGVDCGGDCATCGGGVSCTWGGDCDTGACQNGSCGVGTCDDGVRNAEEGDIDCGRTCPQKCAPGQQCREPTDCTIDACDQGQCVAHGCDNGTQDNAETDVDCGGGCLPCGVSQGCGWALDCQSRICEGGTCQPRSCDDGVWNGNETDVDCGSSCPKCGMGQRCDQQSDCADTQCYSGICQPPRCSDGMQNGHESDVDCGGPACPRCDPPASCAEGADCATGVCNGGQCADASCSDGVQNGEETDVDCGPFCDGCGPLQRCVAWSDCQPALTCAWAGVCTIAACDSYEVEGSETDLNCGGEDCSPCGDGKLCREGRDCVSGVCDGDRCAAATCQDGITNGGESGVDCGGPQCPLCSDGATCRANGDCASGICWGSPLSCHTPSCTDGVQNGNETDIDCGGAECESCIPGQVCSHDGDCGSLFCDNGFCQAATCGDGRQNQGESGVDCGGLTACARCSDGESCSQPSDCASGNCPAGTCAPAVGCGGDMHDCDGMPSNGCETNVSNNDQYCGDCFTPCTGGQQCVGGSCGCPGGLTWCEPDGCVDTNTSNVHCGACDSPCANCVGGNCQGGTVQTIQYSDTTWPAPCVVGDNRFSHLMQWGSGDDRMLLVSVMLRGGGQDVADVSYAGVPMPLLSQKSLPDFTLRLYYLRDAELPPAPISADVNVVVRPGVSECIVYASSFRGVDQKVPYTHTDSGNDAQLTQSLLCPEDGSITYEVFGYTDTNASSTDGSPIDQTGDGGLDGLVAYRSCAGGMSPIEWNLTAPADHVWIGAAIGPAGVAQCSDRAQTGDETDADCGGSQCAPCPVNATCGTPGDCVTGVCSGTCQGPACNDGARNADESDTDCGGSCSGCANNLRCNVGADCAGGICSFAACYSCGDRPAPPGGACPTVCTAGCLGAVCNIDCDGTNPCRDQTLICPAGWECNVTCSDTTACQNARVVCTDVHTCNIACTGVNACQSLTVDCGPAPCDLVCNNDANVCDGAVLNCGSQSCSATCNGSAAAPAVNCGSSCSCSPC